MYQMHTFFYETTNACMFEEMHARYERMSSCIRSSLSNDIAFKLVNYL